MRKLFLMAWSSIGKKLLVGLTGLMLSVFVAVHLLGNLTLLFGRGEAFNRYAHSLERWGLLLYAGELGLLLAFVIHAVTAVAFYRKSREARPVGYYKVTSGGKPSRKSVSSSTMVYTGLLLLVFTILHLKTFKFGPGVGQGYVMQLQGENVRDLYRLVVEVFSNRWYVLWYVGAMLFLGFHLHHGFWSAFQSLGAYSPRLTPAIYMTGIVFAIVIAGGFLFLPIWIYFNHGGVAQ